MGNWKYYQLIATFYKALFALIAQGVKINDAIHRVFEDFYFLPEEENILCNLVSNIQYIIVLHSLEKNVNAELINSFNLQLNKISGIRLEDYLSTDEIEHLEESIEEVKYKIKAKDRI